MAGAGGAGAAAEGKQTEAEVSYRNAMGAYETTMKNNQSQYEYEGKKYEMMLPNVKVTADGDVIVSEFKDGKYQVRAVPGAGSNDADKLKKVLEGIGMPGPIAEMKEVEYLGKIYSKDPVALQTSLIMTTVRRTIENGAGAAVWGQKYIDAKAEAEKRIQPGLLTDPEAYRAAFAREMTALLMEDPDMMTDQSWMEDAAKYGSVSASILRRSGGQVR
jgi:hypothetical protein